MSSFFNSKKVPLTFKASVLKYKKYHHQKLIKVKFSSSRRAGNCFCVVTSNTLRLKTSQLVAFAKVLRPMLKATRKKAGVQMFSYPLYPITQKAKDIRMGRGKGAVTGRVAQLAGGRSFMACKGLSSIELYRLYSCCFRSKFGSKVQMLQNYK